MAYTIIASIGELILPSGVMSTNKAVFMTLDNEVYLLGNLRAISNQVDSVIAQLPDEDMWPSVDTYIPAYTGSHGFVPLHINSSGEIRCMAVLPTLEIIYTNGLCFNVGAKYYNAAIGNIYNNGTSPLSEV